MWVRLFPAPCTPAVGRCLLPDVHLPPDVPLVEQLLWGGSGMMEARSGLCGSSDLCVAEGLWRGQGCSSVTPSWAVCSRGSSGNSISISPDDSVRDPNQLPPPPPPLPIICAFFLPAVIFLPSVRSDYMIKGATKGREQRGKKLKRRKGKAVGSGGTASSAGAAVGSEGFPGSGSMV